MKNRNLNHSNNWKTPNSLYSILDDEFHFDFDPCPYNEKEIILPHEDGLLIDWGYMNFVNPPYSIKLKEAFVKRAIEFKLEGKFSVLLLPVSTSTKLFHDHILPNANEIRFLYGRPSFQNKNNIKNKGMHDSMIVTLLENQKTKLIVKSLRFPNNNFERVARRKK